MLLDISMAFSDLLRRTLLRLAFESLRILADFLFFTHHTFLLLDQ